MKLKLPTLTGKSILTLLATIAVQAATHAATEALAKRAEKKVGAKPRT